MKRALPALVVPASLLAANSAAACGPSGGEALIVFGVLGLFGLFSFSLAGLAVWGLWRLSRRFVQRDATFIT